MRPSAYNSTQLCGSVEHQCSQVNKIVLNYVDLLLHSSAIVEPFSLSHGTENKFCDRGAAKKERKKLKYPRVGRESWIKCGVSSLCKIVIFWLAAHKRTFLLQNVLRFWLTLAHSWQESLALSGSISGSLWLILTLSGSFWLTLPHSGSLSSSLKRSFAHKACARFTTS